MSTLTKSMPHSSFQPFRASRLATFGSLSRTQKCKPVPTALCALRPRFLIASVSSCQLARSRFSSRTPRAAPHAGLSALSASCKSDAPSASSTMRRVEKELWSSNGKRHRQRRSCAVSRG